jgi:hypothetical protein
LLGQGKHFLYSGGAFVQVPAEEPEFGQCACQPRRELGLATNQKVAQRGAHVVVLRLDGPQCANFIACLEPCFGCLRELEPDFRGGWEKRHPETPWGNARGATRDAWEDTTRY